MNTSATVPPACWLASYSAFLVSGVLGIIGVLLAWAALPRMNVENPTELPRAMLSFRQVFGNRDVLVLIVGYAATIWGTAGLRRPKTEEFDQVEINKLVDDLIVGPTIAECGTSVFTLNHSLVMGMIYWLAEQCFIQWHP